MQNFKTFLIEGQDKFAPWHIRDIDELKKFVAKSAISKSYDILKDGSVRFKTTTTFHWSTYAVEKFPGSSVDKLPFKINSAYNIFVLDAPKLLDIWGAPDTTDTFEIRCEKLPSFKHLEGTYKNGITINCKELEEFNCKVNTPIVFIYNAKKIDAQDVINSFPNLQKLTIFTDALDVIYRKPIMTSVKHNIHLAIALRMKHGVSEDKMSEIRTVMDIANKHLGNMFACQEKLIEAGFKEYAKL
jgi:hypothetical protein